MRMCKRPKSGSFRGSGKSSQRGKFQRVNLIGQATDQSEHSSGENDKVVLHLAGNTGTPPFMLKGKINKQPFQTMIDSGSPITIFTKEDIRQITKSDVLFTRPLPKNEQYVDYNGKRLNLLGYITVDGQVERRNIKKAKLIIVRDGKRSLIGRDWLTQLNFRVAKASKESEYPFIVNNIESKVELSPELKRIQQKFPKIFSRKGKIAGHSIKIEFKEGAKITQHKGRRVPLQLQKAVDAKVRNLLAAGHIKRVDKISVEMFIQPVVITVKKDRSVKIALDARSLNNAILKSKHQRPNLESLMQNMAEVVNEEKDGEVWFSSFDMLYACGQTPLHPNTARHCNFQIVGGESTGTYAFNTGYYGLTIIPPEFQNIMDKILHATKNTFTFLHDILIVTKGTHEAHMQ